MKPATLQLGTSPLSTSPSRVVMNPLAGLGPDAAAAFGSPPLAAVLMLTITSLLLLVVVKEMPSLSSKLFWRRVGVVSLDLFSCSQSLLLPPPPSSCFGACVSSRVDFMALLFE